MPSDRRSRGCNNRRPTPAVGCFTPPCDTLCPSSSPCLSTPVPSPLHGSPWGTASEAGARPLSSKSSCYDSSALAFFLPWCFRVVVLHLSFGCRVPTAFGRRIRPPRSFVLSPTPGPLVPPPSPGPFWASDPPIHPPTTGVTDFFWPAPCGACSCGVLSASPL
jgi:hypothetical protein